MAPAPFPVPDATVPFWRTELHGLDFHRSTPELPERQDIVTIGAGFASAALAHYLLKETPVSKPSITILEAQEACSGATRRNDGTFLTARRHVDKPELWRRNFDDASLIEPAVPFFEQWASKNLVDWEKAEMKIENVWTGIMGYTSDNLPHVGAVPGKRGLYTSALALSVTECPTCFYLQKRLPSF
ncbi:hypothetical protein E0Z10_g8491 [Xylaria hypoxylon]|uniref:FAD dependent oxidoreductase domain-containing protein n=1 Tax=Xylaria hypoxylon TaxID=37992 RepID=A0A4Z0YLE9_9PEZI|nr:hypothetical protein E0Z10_g8491 [Xylaria hypoxylon]